MISSCGLASSCCSAASPPSVQPAGAARSEAQSWLAFRRFSFWGKDKGGARRGAGTSREAGTLEALGT